MKTWAKVKALCESIDAYLVEIESLEENKWILVNIVHQHFISGKVWIGGSDQINEKDLIWSNSGNKITFNQWSPHEPNDFKDNEDCIEMYASNGKWNDMSCGSTNPFVCEKNINWYTENIYDYHKWYLVLKKAWSNPYTERIIELTGHFN